MKIETDAIGRSRAADDPIGLGKGVPVRAGEILAGKYRVDRVLGVGGMGVVVAAHHVQLDERVAIKFLLPSMLSNSEALARFSREARAAVKIKSEHVARVSDVGTLDNGAPYMVMEYLDGADLAAWLAREGPLPVEQAVEFVLQACEAIAEAHVLGIVHRDLKPSNLFVIRRPDGALSVKVLDFGISKVTSASGSTPDAAMTRTSALMGSPLYMAPEQIRSSKDVDTRADLWSLGVILYELVTGSCPFTTESIHELLYKILSEAPVPLRDKRADVPEGLERVILRCLDKDLGKRFESVGELALALLPFGPKRARGSVDRISGVMKAAGFSGTAVVPPASSESGPAQSATAASWGRTASRTSSTRSRAFIAIAVLATGAAVAGTLLYSKGDPAPPTSSASAAASLPAAAVADPVPAAPASVVAAEPAPSATPPATAGSDRGASDVGMPPTIHRPSGSKNAGPPTSVPKIVPASVAPVLTAPVGTTPVATVPVKPRPRPTDIYDERK